MNLRIIVVTFSQRIYAFSPLTLTLISCGIIRGDRQLHEYLFFTSRYHSVPVSEEACVTPVQASDGGGYQYGHSTEHVIHIVASGT